MVVQLQDGLQLAIPSWMLDPLRCQSLRDKAVPVISIDALRQLAELVAQYPLSPKRNGDSPCSSNHQGGNDEQESALPPTGAAGT